MLGDYDVFDVQERVIEDILGGYREQRALEAAPKSLDPFQQTVATTIQSYLHRPEVKRKTALAAIRFLNQPVQSVVIKELRSLLEQFEVDGEIVALIDGVTSLAVRYEAARENPETSNWSLRYEDLKLICFDNLCS